MRFFIATWVLFLALCFNLSAQELVWKVGLDFYFDNAEYANSTFTDDWTISGIHLKPEIGVRWDKGHSIYGGVDGLKLFGSYQKMDSIGFLLYYRYKTDNTTLLAGVFPRENLFSDYSEFFMQKSVTFFHPSVQGVYWKQENQNSYIKVWLDWLQMRTKTRRESFSAGVSGFTKKDMFFSDFQFYMLHLANTEPSRDEYGVYDYFTIQAAAGVDFSARTPFRKLSLSAGILAGFERDRKFDESSHLPIGLVVRSAIEYKALGLHLNFYQGNPRMKHYDRYKTSVYWGTPFLRTNSYLDAKIFLRYPPNRFVNGDIAVNLHFSQGKVMFEQVFTLSANLEGLFKKSKP